RWSWLPLFVGIPISLTVTAILHANNLRDLDEDRRSGKRTLAVRLGTDGAIWEFRILIVGALAADAALAVVVTPLALAGLLSAPWAWQAFQAASVRPVDGRALMRRTS